MDEFVVSTFPRSLANKIYFFHGHGKTDIFSTLLYCTVILATLYIFDIFAHEI